MLTVTWLNWGILGTASFEEESEEGEEGKRMKGDSSGIDG